MKRNLETNNIIEEIHDFCMDFNNRQIYLHDSIKEDNDDGIDYKVATRFIKNMAILESTDVEPIVIHQHSYGGYIHAGFAIYDCIKTSACHVTVVCHGCTMSMATVILQAADMRVAMPNCSFMFHHGSADIGGTHKQSQSWARHNQSLVDRVIDLYIERIQSAERFKGHTMRQIKNHITANFDKKEDWILTAEEALDYGFIDKIVGEKEFKSFVQRG